MRLLLLLLPHHYLIRTLLSILLYVTFYHACDRAIRCMCSIMVRTYILLRQFMSQPSAPGDIELAQASNTAVLEGYPFFAEFIAKDRDAAIYHKFERLSARSLLYQQSELHDLERQLDELDQSEARDIDDDEARKAAVS